MNSDNNGSGSYTLNELCGLTGVNPRTARYYMQIGLLDRPTGETRAARYEHRHLDQLLSIRKWSEAGLSLERIRELLHGEPPDVPARAPSPGTVSVRSHLHLADGLELVIDPGRTRLTPEQLRGFCQDVLAVYEQRLANGSADHPPSGETR